MESVPVKVIPVIWLNIYNLMALFGAQTHHTFFV